MSQKQIAGWHRSETGSKLRPRWYGVAARSSLQFSIAELGVACVMESTSIQPTCSLHPTVQIQEPGQGVQRPQEEPQAEEHHHRHHHHHHPQKDPAAMATMDHHLKEESEVEQQVAGDLNLTDSILQKGIIPIQWSTFMRRLWQLKV